MPVRIPRHALPVSPGAPPDSAEAAAACHSWYEAYGGSIYGYLRFHLPSADAAEDLTAEAFLRALRSYEAFNPALGTPKAWLFRIAQNVLRDYHRQAGRRRTVSLTGLRDLRSAAPSPEERLLWEEEVTRLLSAIAELPRKDREIVSLAYGTELTIGEIGEILGSSSGAARTRLWRALGRLRKVLCE